MKTFTTKAEIENFFQEVISNKIHRIEIMHAMVQNKAWVDVYVDMIDHHELNIIATQTNDPAIVVTAKYPGIIMFSVWISINDKDTDLDVEYLEFP